jgi:hypothetical protein
MKTLDEYDTAIRKHLSQFLRCDQVAIDHVVPDTWREAFVKIDELPRGDLLAWLKGIAERRARAYVVESRFHRFAA